MLTWSGLQRYGFAEEAQRLAYKWLYMLVLCYHIYSVPILNIDPRLTFAFASFNGLVPEKVS